MSFTQYSNQKKHMQMQVPCEEFASMGFESFAPSLTASSVSTTSSNLSGWGSVASRKPYTCLASLGNDYTRTTFQVARSMYEEQVHEQEPTWGYFVDAAPGN